MEDVMKRNLITILPLLVTALIYNAAAYGQSYPASDVQANVPFNFNVGTARLPAGCYGLLTLNQQGIMIRNCKTGATVFSLVQKESRAIQLANWFLTVSEASTS